MERSIHAYRAELKRKALQLEQIIAPLETQHANEEVDTQFNGLVTYLADRFTVRRGPEGKPGPFNEKFILGSVIAMLAKNPSDEWLRLKSVKAYQAIGRIYGQRGALSDQDLSLKDALEETQKLQEGKKLQDGYNEKLIMLYLAAHNQALATSNTLSHSKSPRSLKDWGVL